MTEVNMAALPHLELEAGVASASTKTAVNGSLSRTITVAIGVFIGEKI